MQNQSQTAKCPLSHVLRELKVNQHNLASREITSPPDEVKGLTLRHRSKTVFWHYFPADESGCANAGDMPFLLCSSHPCACSVISQPHSGEVKGSYSNLKLILNRGCNENV